MSKQFEELIEGILYAVAHKVMVKKFGIGEWKAFGEDELHVEPEECLDVKVGDKVYLYDECDCAAKRYDVVFKDQHGVPYVVDWGGGMWKLFPVRSSLYFKTMAELCSSCSQLKNDRTYHLDRFQNCDHLLKGQG